MHPFPSAKEIDFLIGCQLQSVTLMRWQTHFEFDRAKLNVEWAFEHVDHAGSAWLYSHEGDGLEPLNLRRLCQQKVRLISVEPLTLTFAFSEGDVLKVFTEDSQYECGQIYDAGGNIIVF